MKDKWKIVELTPEEAHEIVRSKPTGQLTTHFNQGHITGYEWKEKWKELPIGDNPALLCERLRENSVDRRR